MSDRDALFQQILAHRHDDAARVAHAHAPRAASGNRPWEV